MRGTRDDSPSQGNWNHHALEWLGRRPQKLWRQHSDAVNGDLLEGWLPDTKSRWLLKTNLFDEAVSEGLFGMLNEKADNVIGLDIATGVVAAAARRHPDLTTIGADVRSLPIATESIDAIVSLATLDHFGDISDIEDALCELRRVLVPGGTLIVTIDNPMNPIIALRNSLPFRLTHAVGLVRYPVGKTQRPSRFQRLVEDAGFDVLECTAIMHAPRVLAIPVLEVMSRITGTRTASSILRSLFELEALGSAPTRYVTGHFVAIRALKA